MTNKMPKAAYQILFGFLILIFTVVACNNKKEEKKDPPPDTATVKPADPMPADTAKGKDTVADKPVKDPPPPPPAPMP
jgi:type IV secretory pathway VirB10-like protein